MILKIGKIKFGLSFVVNIIKNTPSLNYKPESFVSFFSSAAYMLPLHPNPTVPFYILQIEYAECQGSCDKIPAIILLS